MNNKLLTLPVTGGSSIMSIELLVCVCVCGSVGCYMCLRKQKTPYGSARDDAY